MTDSMKFGPEWLRNLSTETVPPFSGNNNGGGTGGGGGVGVAMGSYAAEATKNNQISSTNGHGVNAPPPAGVVNPSNSVIRNTFSEFRYGREEMLLLFDRQTTMPEILPQFKNIFVDRVQFPLALVPNTDEEAIASGTPAIAQKATWLQRSPIPFNTSTRGSIRGGIVDRGRMRGKPSYHPAYQRSVSTFEDDGRSSLIKAGRSSDALAAGAAAIGLPGSESWNNTTIFSPRKDFGGGHSKNMENWRRSRNEAYPVDAATAGAIPPNNPDGWRMNSSSSSSSFANGHTRLNKLSNWRDEDNLPNTDAGGEIDKSKIGVGGKPVGGLQKDPGSNSNVNLWALNNAPNGVSSNCSSFESNNEDFLPEWATENTSGIGGSFDATGAFHDDEVGLRMKYFAEQKYLREKDREIEAAQANETRTAQQEVDSSESPPTATVKQLENKENLKEDNVKPAAENNYNAMVNDISESDLRRKLAEDYPDASNNKTITPPENDSNSNENSVDYTDNMMEVADDMVEKLVMDDNDDLKRVPTTNAKSNVSALGECNDLGKSSVLAPSLQEQNLNSLNALNHNGFPAQASDVGLPAPFSLNAASMSLDHAQNPVQLFNMQQQQQQQHQQQQQQQLQQQMSSVSLGMKATAPPPSHNASTNLWFYRDPQSKVQGPFSALEMAEWYRAGYFNDNLYVRRACDVCFRALGDLIKLCNGHVPFTHTHLIPIGSATNPVHPVTSPLTIAQQPATARVSQNMDFFQKSFGSNNNLPRDDFKANASAAAESLSKALRSLINLDDMSKVVNLHFQTLQERYVRCSEIEIIKELTEHESFRQLDSAEQDAIVRQKFQTIVLPEYLTSLAGLSNTLALLNPAAESLLYNTIIECSKKRAILHTQQQAAAAAAAAMSSTETQQQQQQQLHHSVTGFSGPENYISQHQAAEHQHQHPETPSNTSSDPLQNFLLDMSAAAAANSLVEPHFLGSPPTTTTTNNATNNVHNATANPTVRLWMSQFNDRQQLSQQQQQLFNQPTAAAASSNYKWNSGPLFGMPSISLPKPVPMWNVSEIEQHRLDQQQLQQQQQQQHQQQQQQHQQQTLRNEQAGFELPRGEHDSAGQRQQYLAGELNKIDHSSEPGSEQHISKILKNSDLEEKQKHQQNSAAKQQQSSVNDKNQYNFNQTSNNTNKPFSMKQQKEDVNDVAAKEEAKRQQLEQQQRQLAQQQQQLHHNQYQFEEVKSRNHKQQQHQQQQAEENKKQQQLQQQQQQQQQQQRHKVAADTSSKANNISNHHPAPTNNIKIVKEPQQKKSQVAPWVNQALATKNQIDLAEIQKAEKRERRADQQRQLEMQEKQMQLALANAAQENVLKWNRSPVPVKSFAEIQAEEARRLAKEQVEQQRRKAEQEQQYQTNVEASGLNSSAFIWGNSKLWAASAANLSGFWEDTQKEQKTVKDSVSTVQRNSKIQSSSSPNSARNAKKLPGDNTMAAAAAAASSLYTSSSNPAINKKNTTAAASSSSNTTAAAAAKNIAKNKSEDIKNNSKSNHHTAAKKGGSADCEADFVNWCTDSLNNMKTEVDVPTFVSFLSDLESPDEVREYIRAYLGETKEFLDFAKQFLERRSKLKSLKRAQNAHIDDLCKPAMAITPSANENGDNKGKPKKPKKNKMTKLDARILGFSVTAAEGRINVGDRDYVDGS